MVVQRAEHDTERNTYVFGCKSGLAATLQNPRYIFRFPYHSTHLEILFRSIIIAFLYDYYGGFWKDVKLKVVQWNCTQSTKKLLVYTNNFSVPFICISRRKGLWCSVRCRVPLGVVFRSLYNYVKAITF